MPWDFVATAGEFLGGDAAAATTAAEVAGEAGAAGAADAAAGAGAAGAGEAAAAGAGATGAGAADAALAADNAGGIGGALGDTSANYTAGMGSANALTGAASPSVIQQLATATGLTPTQITSLGGAAISSLAGLYGANKIAGAGQTAANLSSNASLAATQLQAQQYADQVARQQPFYQAGLNALPAYTQGVMPGGNLVAAPTLNQLQMDPGYGFRFDQGMKGLNASMAAKGLGVSGAGIKGAVDYGQAAGSQEYNNAYNRYIGTQTTQRNALAGLTGFAPTAAGSIASSGTNYANNVGNLLASNATTQGNAALNSAAATQSAYGGAGTAFANALNPNPMNAWFTSQLAKG